MAKIEELKKLEDSVSTEAFIEGLQYATKRGTLGEAWEKSVTCEYCKFADQCQVISDAIEENGKYPFCHDIVSVLLGEIKVEDLI